MPIGAKSREISSKKPALARVWTLAAALLLSVLAPAAAPAEPLDLRLRPVAIDTEDAERTRVGALEFFAGFVLTSDDARFGGLSGLSLGEDGRTLVSVSDRGWWLTARLRLAPDGRLAGIEAADILPLKRPDGHRIRIDHAEHDAEAVERLADGSLAVGFERRHRLWRYAAPGGPAQPFVTFPELEQQPLNGGVEALSPLGDGRLLLLSEEDRDERGDLKGWLWQAGRAVRVGYATVGSFRPTDLALLPGGDVLVLERRFSLIGGAGARLALVPGASLRAGARLEGREIARLEWPLLTDNFEGLAVATAPGGGDLVYLLSDDNFNPLQDTLLLQFRLRP